MTTIKGAEETFAHRKIDRKTKFLYGLGYVAYGVKDNGFNYFLMLYYNQVLGLPAQLAALALLLTLISDAISDPLIGYISDNLRTKWGRRHPFMYAAALPVAISYFFLWNPLVSVETAGVDGLFLYMLGLSVVVRFFITLFEIPNTALVSEFTGDYDQRTSIMSYRYFFGWWGGLTVAWLAYSVFLTPTEADPSGMINEQGFRTYGLVASLMILGAVLISSLGTHQYIPILKQPPERRNLTVGQTLKELGQTLGNRSFLALFVSAVFFYIAIGFNNALYNYIQVYFWELQTLEIRWMTVAHFFSALLALVIAAKIAVGREKKHVAIAIGLIAVVVQPLPIILRLMGLFPANDSEILLPILIAHSAFEVTLWVLFGTMVSSMIADLVEDSQRRTKRRSEGLFFASRTFAMKVVSGIGISVTGMVLAGVGFPERTVPGQVDPEIIRDLGLAYVPIYVTFGVISMFVMLFYRISRSGHEDNLVHVDEPVDEQVPKV
ncbi:MAG: MFS transporter [Alphaproteobacteria bacterium]|nr:MFS transporter [Alphaproteobacteria bacterium]